jgi:hypothetical protein
MFQECLETLVANIAHSNVFMPVSTGSEATLGIVQMDELEDIETQNNVKALECFLNAARAM